MNEVVLLKTYTYRHEAEVAKALLESHSINSLIQADDCGAMDPALSFASAVNLLVSKKDLPIAQNFLKEQL